MMKALVVFGSQSDEPIFKPINDGLKASGIEYEFVVCSAHRDPEKIDLLVKKEFGFIIAGAGLSAALPGVIASKTLKPVIGVPCKSSYEGLDALLSIMQLPPGTPVLSVGVNATSSVLANSIKLQKSYSGINIISSSHSRAQEKAEKTLREFDIPYKISNDPDKGEINIRFVELDEEIPEREELVICCPLTLEEDDKAEAALNLLPLTSNGLWVGLNNGMNAALAAIQILNKSGKYTSHLQHFREKRKTPSQIV